MVACLASWLASAAGPLDPTTAGGSVDGILALMPVTIAPTAAGYTLEIRLRNDTGTPLRLPMSEVRCLRGGSAFPIALDRPGADALPLAPGEASRLRMRCDHGPGPTGPPGLRIPEVLDLAGVVLADVVWQLHEALLLDQPLRGAAPTALSYRRPAPEPLSRVAPNPQRIEVPVGDPDGMREMGFVPWGEEADRFVDGRFRPGPNLGEWMLRPGSGRTADTWFDGAAKGWAVEARVRVEEAGDRWNHTHCAGVWIHDGIRLHHLSFEPDLVRLDAATAPADLGRLSTWRVDAGENELVLTRDGDEVLRTPRAPGGAGTVSLNFGHLGNCDVASEWAAFAFEANLGQPRWTER